MFNPEPLGWYGRLARAEACSVLTFRHLGARVALIATREPDGRTLVTADIFSPGHHPYSERWTMADATVEDAVADSRSRSMALVEELDAGWSLAAA